MEMFNKLKSTLSTSVTNTIQNTVYNTGNIISGVIPGKLYCFSNINILWTPSVSSEGPLNSKYYGHPFKGVYTGGICALRPPLLIKKSYSRTDPYIDSIFDYIFYLISVWKKVTGFKISVRSQSTNSRCNYPLRTLVLSYLSGLSPLPLF